MTRSPYEKNIFFYNCNGEVVVEECDQKISRIGRSEPQGREIGRFSNLEKAFDFIFPEKKYS